MNKMEHTADKKRHVTEMFNRIAPTYDRLNHLLSFQIDRRWRAKVVRMAAKETPHTILDVATGTGDLAIELARRIPSAEITGVDISENMLAIGRRKVAERGLSGRVTLAAGDAEALNFADNSFDCVTVGFGVRNFGDIGTGVREMYRVTREGGISLILEFSKPTVPLFSWAYRIYFHKVLPRMGRAVSKDSAAYTYLPTSVQGFPAPERFAEMLRQAGFTQVTKKRLTGGVAYIYKAMK
jgi:demethylmenaquinone methyltransferase/2-methoxy-6-polyprenyl-1,4-benzoquinol methylase